MLANLAFSPNGSFYVSARYDQLKIWDTQTGKVRLTRTIPHGHCASIAISQDSTFIIAVAENGGGVTLWDSATGTEQGIVQPNEQSVEGTCCAFSPDGANIITTAKDGTIRIWETISGKEKSVLKHHANFLQTIAISPDGNFLVAASHEGMRMQMQNMIPEASFGSGTNNLSVWDFPTGHERSPLVSKSPPAGICAISPDASFIVSVHMVGGIIVWDAETGKYISGFQPDSLSTGIAISPDGASIITTSMNGALTLWDAKTGSEMTSIVLPDELLSVALHPYKPLAICGGKGGKLHVIDLVGVSYGPIITTPIDMGDGHVLCCPDCSKLIPLQIEWLGKTINCPERDCSGKLRVTPFKIDRPSNVRKLLKTPTKEKKTTGLLNADGLTFDQVTIQDGVTCELFTSEDTEKAKQFLLNKRITIKNYSVRIDTPHGIWGTSKDGIFLEELLPWQKDLNLEKCKGKIRQYFSEKSLLRYENGSSDNAVAMIRCGKCKNKWWDAIRPNDSTIVRCPKCNVYNNIRGKKMKKNKRGLFG